MYYPHSIAAGWLTSALFDLLAWIFDPTRLLDWAFTVFGALLTGLGYLIPGEFGTKFQAMGSTFSSVPWHDLTAVAGWFVSPIVSTSLFLACLGVLVDVWVITLLIKLLVYIKGHLWSSSS